MNLSLLSILFLYYVSPISALNQRFTHCNKTIQCGKLTNITYPFYDGETRPDYCGYPGLKLVCENGTPLINISSKLYNLLGINKAANTIKVSKNKFSTTNPCPDSLHDAIVDSRLFNFSSADENITFYGCNQTVKGLRLQTECGNLGPRLMAGYYMTTKMKEMSNVQDLIGICQSTAMPILKSSAKVIDKSQNTAALINAFVAGFELGLIVGTESSCIPCVGSGGACGFNSTSRKFVCYCPDADFDVSCVVSPSTNTSNDKTSPADNHHIHTIPIVLGASIGGALLLVTFILGCWCLFLLRSKKLQIEQERVSRYAISSSLANNGIPIAIQGTSGPSSSQGYTSTSSATNSCSVSSYASSRPEDERASAYFGVPIFDYSELQHATQDFDDSRELGSGGYGRVYYGELQDGRQVAVKRLYEKSFRRMEQFMNEIEIFARLRHKNLVTLYGCTSTKSRLLVLVYEYVPNGTVADHLHGKQAQTAFLEWPIRLSIAVETAEALAYLHKLDVIHRDVKTTNILLDNEFHVKVADFGLSRLFPNEATHVSTYPQGTPGYVDPEYYTCFRLTEKSDVYSFGVILIEIISSMQAVDGARGSNHVNLASMALDRIQNRALHELVDPRLGFERDHEVQRMVKMVAELGFRCLQSDKDMRPTMEEVVIALRGIQMVEARSTKQEGMVGVGCGDEVVLLKSMTT